MKTSGLKNVRVAFFSRFVVWLKIELSKPRNMISAHLEVKTEIMMLFESFDEKTTWN